VITRLYCEADRASFDLEPGHRPIPELMDECMACPLLRECRKAFDAAPAGRYGVIAGLYRPAPVNEHYQGSWDTRARVLAYVESLLDTALPGDQLPSTRELETRTGTGRSVVGAVYRDLAQQGRVSVSPGTGAGVLWTVLPHPSIPAADLDLAATA
jgi:hypothetical protein